MGESLRGLDQVHRIGSDLGRVSDVGPLLRRNDSAMTRLTYLSDEMRARVEPLLPPVKGVMGRPMREHRVLIEGAIYRDRTGIAWDDKP